MKSLISWALKKIPRKYLQLFSHFVLRIMSLFYRGNQVECPICESQFRKFLPYGRVSRENALCPSCLALERHRLLWLFLKRNTEFFEAPLKMLHIAPELCYIDRFESLDNLDYITADIESPLAKVKMDIHEIPFEANSFDVIFCNHVLEHVRDDHLAMTEMLRVLRPGGWAILQIPIFHPLREATYEDPTITDPQEREKAFGQDDHVRMYGKDYPERIGKAGFEVSEVDLLKQLKPEEVVRFALPNEVIYMAVKPTS
ncbi:MAG: class I SAM-dependent methyltransferase [Cytophagales bacterium]|nr:class I SAM-dependent methyltransferase [Cytophagales bacterium]